MKINKVGRAWRVGLCCVHVLFLYIAVVNARAEDSWFGERLLTAFAEDLRTPAYTSPAQDASPPQRRIPPAPFDSPPFPAGDWQIGGTPIIGDPGNLAPWPLMEAIYAGPNGEAWKKAESKFTAGKIFHRTLALLPTHRADRTRTFRSFTICVRTVSSKTSSFSTSSACRTNSRPITSTGAFASLAFMDSITVS